MSGEKYFKSIATRGRYLDGHPALRDKSLISIFSVLPRESPPLQVASHRDRNKPRNVFARSPSPSPSLSRNLDGGNLRLWTECSLSGQQPSRVLISQVLDVPVSIVEKEKLLGWRACYAAVSSQRVFTLGNPHVHTHTHTHTRRHVQDKRHGVSSKRERITRACWMLLSLSV